MHICGQNSVFSARNIKLGQTYRFTIIARTNRKIDMKMLKKHYDSKF